MAEEYRKASCYNPAAPLEACTQDSLFIMPEVNPATKPRVPQAQDRGRQTGCSPHAVPME